MPDDTVKPPVSLLSCWSLAMALLGMLLLPTMALVELLAYDSRWSL